MCWSGGEKGEADGLAVGVGAVEIPDGKSSVGEVVIGDKSCAGRASRAVEAEGE